LLAYLALASAIFGMSWSALFVRWADVPASASAFYRVLLALLILLPWRLVRGGRTPARTAMWLAVAGGAFFAFDLLLFNSAVLRTSAATAVLLGNNAPIFVGLASWFIFRRRPRLSFWIGLAFALAGCGLIVLWDASRTSAVRRGGDAIGDLFALSAAVFWAGYMVTTERVRAEMDTLTFNVIAVTATAVTLLLVCLALGISLTGYSAQTWLALVGLALVSQVASYYALVYALGHLPATVTSVSILSQVPMTALLAAALLSEPLTPAQIVGGAVVLAGIYVVTRN
jgi:drug/metabolite transporter (DMT)-like permease